MKFVVQSNIIYYARKLLQQQNTNNITFLLSRSYLFPRCVAKRKGKSKQINGFHKRKRTTTFFFFFRSHSTFYSLQK
jgi:hypothetical protein